jgi:hypothetical protein
MSHPTVVRAYDIFMAARPEHCQGFNGADTDRQTLAGYPVFIIDDAHLCFYNTIDAKGGDIPGAEMPPIVIPFNRFWMEWPVRDPSDNTVAKMPMMAVARAAAFCEWDARNRKLHISVFLCALVSGESRVVFMVDGVFPVTEDWMCQPPVMRVNGSFGINMVEVEGDMSPPRFALGLLAAKNVSRVPGMLSRAQRRHPGQFVKTASDKHYTISIPGVDALKASLARGESAGRRLHIVRGHFADYSEGGGLFGKLDGRYYIAPHVRGDASRGTVTKDYRVIAAQEAV